MFRKISKEPEQNLSIICKVPYDSYFGKSINRSSHRRCFVRKGVLRNFAKFTGKHLCQSLFFNKVADLRSANLLKKRLWHRCFPVNFAKFLRIPFLQNTSWRLLLHQMKISMIPRKTLIVGFRFSKFGYCKPTLPKETSSQCFFKFSKNRHKENISS